MWMMPLHVNQKSDYDDDDTFLNWEKQTWYMYWEKSRLLSIWNGAEIWPLEKGRKCPGLSTVEYIINHSLYLPVFPGCLQSYLLVSHSLT